MDVDANLDQEMKESNNVNERVSGSNEGPDISDMNSNMTVEQLLSNNNTNTDHLQVPHMTHASVLDFTAPENTAYLPYRVRSFFYLPKFG